MAWSTSNRRERLPSDWKAIKKRIFAEKGDRCYVVERGLQCEATATELDHVKRGDDHSDENLEPICREHHRKKSSSEGWAALRKKKAIARWKAEKKFGHQEEHPGSRPHEPFKHPWQRGG